MNEQTYFKELFGLGCSQAEAIQLIRLRTWFTRIAEFDPVSGKALPGDLLRYVNRSGNVPIVDTDPEYQWKDRLYHASEYMGDAFRAVTENVRRQILREHSILPIYAARELDNASLIWISRRPGRNIREKLGEKQAVMAVKRRWSIDTLENRLLKAMAKRLAWYLEKRAEFTRDEQCDSLLRILHRWLHSEEAAGIGVWRNLPPNNTLLHDKNYRKIWNVWGMLRRINDDIANDYKRLPNAHLTVVFWTLITVLAYSEDFHIVQMPVALDYDPLTITPAISVRGFERKKGFWTAQTADRAMVINFQNKQKYLIEVKDNSIVIEGKPYPFTSLQNCVSLIAKTVFNVIIKNNNISEVFETDESDIIIKALFGKDADIKDEVSEYALIDICSVRPTLITNKNNTKELPFRLIRQDWEGYGDIDCGEAKSIILGCPEMPIRTVSMLSLFYTGTPTAAALKAVSLFIEDIKKYLSENMLSALHYLIPDWIDDFALEILNKNIHYAYKDAFPLTRSIAAVGAWQSSNQGNIPPEGAIILVIDIDMRHDAYSITALEGVFDRKIADAVPETHGFHWERYPTITIPGKFNRQMLENLKANNCPFPDEALHLFGFDGLVKEAASLSLVTADGEDKNSWFHIPKDIRDILLQYQPCLNLGEVNKKINELKIKRLPVYLLPIHHSIKLENYPASWKTLGSAWSLAKGGRTVIEWQKSLGGEIPFWRDHLPELSIEVYNKGILERFYLVKDITTIPLRGKQIIIKIQQNFILPGGTPFYRFPLFQGGGKEALQFSACLQSPNFPLSQDTECKLKMTYTYGEDMPYKLRFIPINPDKAGFKSIPVIWKALDADDAPVDLSFPGFPEQKTWDQLQKYPGRDGDGTSDLVEWCVSKLQNLNDPLPINIEREIEAIEKQRKSGYFKQGKLDKNQQFFCFIDVDGVDVFCHSSDFIEPYDPFLFVEGSVMFLEISQGDKGPNGKNITYSKNMPQVLYEYYKVIFQNRNNKKIEGFRKNLFDSRFPVITIWKDHTCGEPETPVKLRDTVFYITNMISNLLKRDDLPDSLKNECFYFLCCLHRDSPAEIILNKLRPFFEDRQDRELRHYSKNIAFVIGSAELDWQKELFERTLLLAAEGDEVFNAIAFEILSIALWRNEGLVQRIDKEKIISMSNQLCGFLKKDCKDITNGQSISGWKLKIISQHLELLLALIRTRGSADKAIIDIFMPKKERAKELVDVLDKLCETLNKKKLLLLSRLTLDIQKPEALYETPDLIYALRLYLTGDSDAHQISVKNVSDDE